MDQQSLKIQYPFLSQPVFRVTMVITQYAFHGQYVPTPISFMAIFTVVITLFIVNMVNTRSWSIRGERIDHNAY